MTQNSINNTASNFTVNNLNISTNTISTTDTNGDLILAPDGTGVISITDAGIVPNGDRAENLGSTTNNWNNFYCNGITFNDGTDIIDHYEKVSYTPQIGYSGGISTPLTYVTQNGYYWRIGDLIFFNQVIVISDKGAGSGNIRLGSLLPQPENNTVWNMYATAAKNTSLRSTGTQFQALQRVNDSDVRFYSSGAGYFDFQQVGQISNTTEIRVSGYYKARYG